MGLMEKGAVGKQMGGFMQTRVRTRPYRVDTLLAKETLSSRRPSEIIDGPASALEAEKRYDRALAADEGGDEFVQKESAAKEFAPGIPAGRVIKPIPHVPIKGENPDWTVSLATHPAMRRGCVSPGTSILMGDGSLRPVERVSSGDEVRVPNGVASVIRLWQNGSCDEWLEVVSATRRLTCTGNHPLFVDKVGWVPAEELIGLDCEVTRAGTIRVKEHPGASRSELADSEIRRRAVVPSRDSRVAGLLKSSGSAGVQSTWYPHSSWDGQPESSGEGETALENQVSAGVEEEAQIPLGGIYGNVEASSRGRSSPASGSQVVDPKVRGGTTFFGRGGLACGMFPMSGRICIPKIGDTHTAGFGEIHGSDASENNRREQLELERRDLQRESGGLDWEQLSQDQVASGNHQGTGISVRVVRGDKKAFRCASSSTLPIFEGARQEEFGGSVPQVPHSGRRIIPGAGGEPLCIRRLPRVIQSRLDLEIKDSHCFYAEGFLVHNSHLDLRLTDPAGNAHSWALNAMPEPGKSTYAPQQATHSGRYARRTEPFTIPSGYGATRPGAQVEPQYVQNAEVVSASNSRVHFLRHHGQETDELVLKRVAEPRPGKPLWVLHNTSKNRQTLEGQKLPSSKPLYKEIRPEQVDFSDAGEVMVPKLDGSHVLVDMKGPGKPMRVYSYRPTERKTGVIEHTFKFPDFQNRTTSSGLKNTLIRAELWASDKDGKALPAERLGGILNSGVPRSRATQEQQGVTLRLTGIDVVRHKGTDYQNKDFGEKLEAMRDITRGTRGLVELPTVARSEEEKRYLLGAIRAGKLPETKEGVVLQRIDGVAPPTKVKFKEQADVYVQKIFDKPRGLAKGQAGGFGYSLSPDGPVVGKVGTGFSHEVRRDMLRAPEKYVGRVAKIESQGPYQSGAFRAPSFSEWHIDKTPPELMKEGAEVDTYKVPAAFFNMDPGTFRAAVETRPTLRAIGRMAEKAPKGVGRIRAYLSRKKKAQ